MLERQALTVLYVGDDPVAHRLVDLLAGSGWKLQVAPTLEAGREMLQLGAYDVVLAAEQVNGHPGLELAQPARLLQSANDGPSSPVPAFILLMDQKGSPAEQSAVETQARQSGATLCLRLSELTPYWLVSSIVHALELKQAQDALRRCEAREDARVDELRAIMDAAPAIMWVTHDPDAREVTGNQAAYDFLRLRREDNLSKTAPELQAPRNFQVLKDGRELAPEELPLQIAAATGRPVRDFEEEVIFDDGSRAYLLGNVTPLLDEAGQPAGAVAAFIDVTERMETEIALRLALDEAEEGRLMLDALMENIPEGVTITAGPPDFVIRRVSRYGLELTGRPSDYSLLGMPAGDHRIPWDSRLADGESRPTIEQMPLYRASHFGEAVTNEEMFIGRSDGSMVPVLVNAAPVRDARGRIVAAVSSWRDITERKRIEQALRERGERLALLSDAATALLNNADPVTLLRWIFSRLSHLLGLDLYFLYQLSEDGSHLELEAISGLPKESQKDVRRLGLGGSVCGTVAQTRRPIIVDHVQEQTDERTSLIRSLGITAYACLPMLVHDRLVGTLAFGSYWRTAFEPEALGLIQAVGDLIATAIDRRNADQNLKIYAEQLEHSNRDLQEFAFVASHDLQEPLRKIETFGDSLLQKADNLNDSQRDYLVRMRQAAGRMRSMVSGLLELSRLEREAQPFKQVDLSQSLNEAISNLEAYIQRTGARIDAGPLPIVEADPQQMERLFQNLIGNALKFQPPDNHPLVKISSVLLDDCRVEITVQDNGIGVAPESIERIFQPFQRAVGRSQYEGSGMGLAICRKIVERHGGTIQVESPGAQGSEPGAQFTITLPIQRNCSQEE